MAASVERRLKASLDVLDQIGALGNLKIFSKISGAFRTIRQFSIATES